MFFGLEWLVITNVIYPLAAAAVIAAADNAPTDVYKNKAVEQQRRALAHRRSEMDKIRKNRADKAAAKAASSAR